jgi:hypothetical protein
MTTKAGWFLHPAFVVLRFEKAIVCNSVSDSLPGSDHLPAFFAVPEQNDNRFRALSESEPDVTDPVQSISSAEQ